MNKEQFKAFQEWWNKSSIGCDQGTVCQEAFASGWAAAKAESLSEIKAKLLIDTTGHDCW